MLLQANHGYQVIPAVLAEANITRGGSFAPTLTVEGGSISLYTYNKPGRPYNFSQMFLDSEEVAPGNYPFIGEFNWLAWKVKSGTPVVSISQSIRLKDEGVLNG